MGKESTKARIQGRKNDKPPEAPITCTAMYEDIPEGHKLINASSGGYGAVSGTKTAEAGKEVRLTAYSFPGWKFDGWKYNGENDDIQEAVNNANKPSSLSPKKSIPYVSFAMVVDLPPSGTLTFTMPEDDNDDIDIIANFIKDKYKLTSSTGPTTAPKTEDVVFETNQPIAFSPKTAFQEWTVQGDNADKNLIDLIADRFDGETTVLQMPDGTLVLVAKYSSSSSTGTGTGTGNGNGNGGGGGGGGDNNVTPPADDGTPKYSVSVTSTEGGTAHANATSAAYQTPMTLTATPNTGYAFKRWIVKNGDIVLSSAINPNAKFSMPPRDVAIEAVFEDPALSPNIARAARASQATAQAVTGGILLQNLPQNASIPKSPFAILNSSQHTQECIS